jgi:phosphate uptake regulator
MPLEPRKIFMSGGSSYIVTLPKNWVEKNGLKAGDSILMDIGRESITLLAEKTEKRPKEAKIRIDGPAETLLRRIISYYLAGYESIFVEIEGEQRKACMMATEMLVGAEILEDYGDKIRIEVFLDESRFKTRDLLEKMANICTSMLEDFSRLVADFNAELCSSILSRENEVDKLYFLILRQLKTAVRYPDVASSLELTNRDILGMRIVIKTLERVADHITLMTESINELGKSVPRIHDNALETLSLFKAAVNSYQKGAADIADEVFVMSKSIKDKIREIEIEGEVYEALKLKTILDGLIRITGYSEDIAEITINLSVQ